MVDGEAGVLDLLFFDVRVLLFELPGIARENTLFIDLLGRTRRDLFPGNGRFGLFSFVLEQLEAELLSNESIDGQRSVVFRMLEPDE